MKKGIILIVLIVGTLTTIYGRKHNNITFSNRLIVGRMTESTIRGSILMKTIVEEPIREVGISESLESGISGIKPEYIVQMICMLLIGAAAGIVLGRRIANLITSIIDWDH